MKNTKHHKGKGLAAMPSIVPKKSHLKVAGGHESQQTLTAWLISRLLSVYGRLFWLCGPRNGSLRPFMRGVCLWEVKNVEF